jgi:hypothetical protein
MCGRAARKSSGDMAELRWPPPIDACTPNRGHLRQRLAEMFNVNPLTVGFAAGLVMAATVTVMAMMASLDLVAQETSVICMSNQTRAPDERQ